MRCVTEGCENELTGLQTKFCSNHCNKLHWEANNRERKAQHWKQSYEKHKSKYNKRKKAQYYKHHDKQLKRAKDWRDNNKDKRAKYKRERYANDEAFATEMKLREGVRRGLSLYSDTGKIMSTSKYGIDIAGIIKHLGKKPDGDYHIDHVRPLSSFDLNDPAQILEAFAPENHQWLLAEDNLRKSDKWAA